MMVRVMAIAGAALLASGCAEPIAEQQRPLRAADVATNPPRALAPPCGAPGVAPPSGCRGD